MIAAVFVFYGVFSPRSTRTLGEGAAAGSVNGEPISMQEFQREYARRREFFQSMMGGGKQLSEDQLKAFHLKEMVFQELVRKKLLLQEATRDGMEASDSEIRDRIEEMPVFQVNGKFDVDTYKKVLAANNFTAGGFERAMREDLSVQRMSDFFKNRVQVSDLEVKKQFLLSEDKRNVRYVLLNTETGKKGVKISEDEVKKFLADPAKLNLAKGGYERGKDTAFKGKTFDQAKEFIARDILAGERLDEVRKVNEQLADKILPLLTADKSSEAKVNAVLKDYDVKVQMTGPVSRLNPYIPGLGEAKELAADLFAAKSPIDPTQGGKAKKYASGSWVAVAVIAEAQRPDPAKFESERPKLVRELESRKERELFDDYLKKLTAKASIDRNPYIVNSDEDSG